MGEEVWKQIPEWDYEVSSLGQICSLKFGKRKILQLGRKNPRGYSLVGLSKNGSLKNFNIGYLVLITFVGKRPKGKEVSHLNGNKSDNQLCNLKWETPEKNRSRA